MVGARENLEPSDLLKRRVEPGLLTVPLTSEMADDVWTKKNQYPLFERFIW